MARHQTQHEDLDARLILAFALTIAAGLGLMTATGRLLRRRRVERVAGLQRQTAEANARTAEARAAAETARLERETLEQATPQPALGRKDRQEARAALSDFVGQHAEINLFPVTFEGRWMAGQIFTLLTSAGWDVSLVETLREPPYGLIVQGVYVQSTGDPESIAAADAVFEALKSKITGGIRHPQPLPDGLEARVWILVGEKPTPMTSWVDQPSP